jgi:GT2 family glycosyltransferase
MKRHRARTKEVAGCSPRKKNETMHNTGGRDEEDCRLVMLSVVVLSWDGPELTSRCVDSVRQNTHLSYELIIVDNGSRAPTRALVRELADHVVQNPTNLGFSAGMNKGLEICRGEYVAFLNNDIIVPPGWDRRMLLNLAGRKDVGMVVPAVTAAGNSVTVRRRPGQQVRTLQPFQEVPSAVVVMLRTNIIRELGGWNEDYFPASAEDADLAYTLWVNGLSVLHDERVLVEHESKGTTRIKFPRWRQIWHENGILFLRRWAGVGVEPAEPLRLAACAPEVWATNRSLAAQTAAAELTAVLATNRPIRRILRNHVRPWSERLITMRALITRSRLIMQTRDRER